MALWRLILLITGFVYLYLQIVFKDNSKEQKITVFAWEFIQVYWRCFNLVYWFSNFSYQHGFRYNLRVTKKWMTRIFYLRNYPQVHNHRDWCLAFRNSNISDLEYCSCMITVLHVLVLYICSFLFKSCTITLFLTTM